MSSVSLRRCVAYEEWLATRGTLERPERARPGDLWAAEALRRMWEGGFTVPELARLYSLPTDVVRGVVGGV